MSKIINYLIDQYSFSSYTPAQMANTKSAIKRIRRISKQTAVNKARKSRYKNALKKMSLLIEKKKKSDALKFLPKLNSELMKIAKTGIIKKQNASRNVSRITKKYRQFNLLYLQLIQLKAYASYMIIKYLLSIFRFSKYI